MSDVNEKDETKEVHESETEEDHADENEGGQNKDELAKLTKTRSGYKAAITHKINIIDGLMSDPKNVDSVFRKHNRLADIWARFDENHRNIMTIVGDQEDAMADHNHYYESEKDRLVKLDEKVSEWIDFARKTLDEDIKPEDSVSQVSISSPHSERSSILRQADEEKAKKRAAEVRLKYLQEEEKLKEEEERLRRQRKLLAAKKELEEAAAREECLREAARDRSVVSKSSKRKKEKVGSSTTSTEGSLSSREMAGDLIKQASAALFLPKQEVPVFSGDPLEYSNFIVAFKSLIEDKTTNLSSRLFYLAQYTSGDVRELVKSCFTMKPEDGYPEALRLLKSRYGQTFRIATAYVDRIIKGEAIKSEKTVGLQKFSVLLTSCNNTLKHSGHINKVENPESFRAIVAKLPFELRRKWRGRADIITEEEVREIKFEDFVKFVEREVRLASHPVFGNLFKEGEKQKKEKIKGSAFATLSSSASDNIKPKSSPASHKETSKCLLCHSDHHLSDCQQFRKQAVDERNTTVKKLGACFNCLHKHLVVDCKVRRRCDHCGKKHSTLLHWTDRARFEDAPKETNKDAAKSSDSDTNTPSKPGNVGAAVGELSQFVSLQVVPVKVQAQNGTWITTNAFLDNGSNMTFCSKQLVDNIGLSGKTTNVRVTTLDQKETKIEGHLYSLNIQDCNSGEYVARLSSVLSRPELPITIGDRATQCDVNQWEHLAGVQLIEEDSPVGLLIGNDNPELLQPLEVKMSPDNGPAPYAVRTILGWVINGPIGKKRFKSGTCSFVRVDSISEQIKAFYNKEFEDSLADQSLQMSVNDRKAMNIMSETTRLQNGHYEMNLPLIKEPIQLPNNKVLAERRLQLLKQRMLKDPQLKMKYTTFMEDLFVNKHAELVSSSPTEDSAPNWFLPHHAVVNPNKPEKVRVVFDCAARYHNTCLNDNLLQGPDMNNSLLGVLIRFRKYRVALMSDIESMFYQVRVTPHHRDLLRFLWWKDGDVSQEPQECRMNVHIYGAKSSPSCCVYALKRTATDNDLDILTRVTIQGNFYMDDCLVSVPDEETAKTLQKDLTATLAKGGFRLTKWTSNSPEVIQSIPRSERAVGVQTVGINQSNDHQIPVERTLGIRWNLQTDNFTYDKIEKVIKVDTVTRRSILSIMSSVFDPLGFVSPALLPARCILQDLCRLNLGWDEPVPDAHVKRWRTWLQDLPALTNFKVPRCLLNSDRQPVSLQLHHFGDASESGYGCVSYMRVVYDAGSISSSIVMAKSRVAPLKTISVPRLELSAATLSVRLDKLIKKELQLPLLDSVFWSDSTAVLKYIRNEDARYQTFVANRIAFIRDGSKTSSWRYVGTSENPADDCSRGLSPTDLSTNTRWLQGPEFLSQPEHRWPRLNDQFEPLSSDDPEVKKGTTAVVLAAVAEEVETPLHKLLERFSNWFTLLRSVAWLKRFRSVLLKRSKVRKKGADVTEILVPLDPINVTETTEAELEVVKLVQRECFADEISSLRGPNRRVKKSSHLAKLNPVMDDDLMTVKGRLTSLYGSHQVSRPKILPRKHHVTTLLIRHVHQQCGHSGREYVLATLRKKYWVVQGNAAVRQVLSRCVQCKKVSGRVGEQKMADVPEVRLGIREAPFARTGIDFFGPFLVKRGRTHVKRYALILTCLTTRAVHLEATFDLSTDSFLSALNRFIARRGKPQIICSDNGGSFVKAETGTGTVHAHLLQKGIDWRFNTPLASHHGGIWERCIRTARKILNAIMCEQTLCDEGLQTLLCEVESVMNGRPLTRQSDDPEDPEALTPNHLLLFQADSLKLPMDVFSPQDRYRRRWRQIQHMADVFWRRWVKVYLPLLQERQKWTVPRRNLAVGNLVLVVDTSLPRNSWPLARVVDTYPGQDGLVRQVQVRTRTGLYRRPIDKLVLLEGDVDDQ